MPCMVLVQGAKGWKKGSLCLQKPVLLRLYLPWAHMNMGGWGGGHSWGTQQPMLELMASGWQNMPSELELHPNPACSTS